MFNVLPILAVLLAPLAIAMAAYFGHVVVRGTKVSELRQAWIDAQRQDLAIVVARAHLLLETRKRASAHDELRLKAFGELEEAAYRIKLRENPRRPEWTDVIERVDRIRALVRETDASHDRLPGLSGGMLPAARTRLKGEWDLVRDGELSYRRTARHYWRYVLILALVAIAVLALGGLRPSTNEHGASCAHPPSCTGVR
jgi:hypothetical protein